MSLADFKDSKLLGHVGDEDVLLVQAGGEVFAIEPTCSHYHGPLAEGLVVGHTIRCPWHHACFSLRTGEATRPPALNALALWEVTRDQDWISVQRKQEALKPSASHRAAPAPERSVIVGGGAAGFAAAEMLRREGFAGGITMLSNDGAVPVDRPNLSKDYLAGNAPEDWLPLRGEDYYADAGIDLRLNTNVSAIDPRACSVTLGNGDRLPFDRLLLATGAEPVKLQIPGAEQPHVHTLRSVADSRAIINAAGSAKRVLVIGASFIGLEVAASLRARKLEVHVVAPEERPMQKVLGAEMGDFVRALHEENGVNFHLKDTVEKLDGTRATLKSGSVIEADLVVVGIGVKPRLALAEHAGLAADRGVSVSEYLETSVAGIFAAGDIALARSAFAANHPRRALGGGGAPGPDRGTQHDGRSRTLRGRAVLLEPALRCADQLCRPCRELRRHRDRRQHFGEGLPAEVPQGRPRAGGCLDLSGSRQSQGRARNGAVARVKRPVDLDLRHGWRGPRLLD